MHSENVVIMPYSNIQPPTCMSDLTDGWKTRLWFSKNDLIRGWGYDANRVTSPVSSRFTDKELFIIFSSLFSNVSRNGPVKTGNFTTV